MKNYSITFTAPWQTELREEEMNTELKQGQVLVQKKYSLISTGTELACLSGNESWFKMPEVAGYCCVSEVIASASDKPDFAKGKLLYHYGTHSLYQIIGDDEFVVLVQSQDNLQNVPMARMATIAFTAIRVSDIELGDYVAVSGLGLVGNMAAQLANLCGARVIGVDPSGMRRQKAAEAGVEFLLPPENAAEEIRNITSGEAPTGGVHTLIEATGIPQVAYDMLPSIGYQGEIIFLGTPRGDTTGNLADVFCYSHLEGRGCITFKGAHEWRYPVEKDKFVKHSIRRNTEIALHLMQTGKLYVDGLISNVVSPKDACGIYSAIAKNRDGYLGVIIDWSKELFRN
ncbi:MAG: zinc-binding alcohol dehydrogenase [Clostridiales bacterium]|jgi:2-desacetyl-2-hydroxyethyl bacteriochlorophyllide A dehydrogenase|nr:zinc-binding alcohol dehydrogenase [Clostridiales bacterium]